MKVVISGQDITDFIANGGLQWSRNDIDGPNAGRALDGTMYRDRVAVKKRYDITLKPVTTLEKNTVLALIEPEFYQAEIDGETFEAYTSSVPAQYLMKINGKEYWTGIKFAVIER